MLFTLIELWDNCNLLHALQARQIFDRQWTRSWTSSARASTWSSSRSGRGKCSTSACSISSSRVQREEFVPPQYRSLAFVDMEIPIGHGEKMLAPKHGSAHAAGARAEPDRPDTGGRHRQRLHDGAARALRRPGLQRGHRARVHAIGARRSSRPTAYRTSRSRPGTPRAAGTGTRPTTRSCSPARCRCCRKHSSSSLAPGGRLLAIVGEPPVMEARLITCAAAGAFSTHRPVRDLHRAAQERAAARAIRVLNGRRP